MEKANTSKYIAESNVEHHGVLYRAGDEVDLTDEEAKPLLGVRSVSHREHASCAALEAPAKRAQEIDEKAYAAAHKEFGEADEELKSAQAALAEAQRRVADAQQRHAAAHAQMRAVARRADDLPHTWEQDADALGGGQLSGTQMPAGLAGEAARAPASGAAATPSSPTQEALTGGSDEQKARAKKK